MQNIFGLLDFFLLGNVLCFILLYIIKMFQLQSYVPKGDTDTKWCDASC